MIHIKTPEEIEKMRRPNRIVAETLHCLIAHVEEGITTRELDAMAEACIRERGGIPAFKGYRGFPCTLCTSINEEVVHGIPSKRKLRSGDIVGLDLGARVDGYYGDSAVTVPVGEVSQESWRLLDVTEKALFMGIAQMKEGNHLGDVSHAIQSYAEGHGYGVVRVFVGHGIGQALHEDPQVPNFGTAGSGPRLRRGFVLALEPMVNAGTHDVRILSDQWTVVTADGKRSAHFEHTVAITDQGTEILTLRDGFSASA
ncbi:MAG: type I methionyl aminopeptidase [Candidatus Tectomicrobia bacterium]|nr:type I methionyl aminopeptidase [Candidatus Tectomicrobia bacterium]